MSKSVLVVFSGVIPRVVSESSYDLVVAPRVLERHTRALGANFEPVEDLIDPGSIEDAAFFLGELARATFPDGRRVSREAVYRGYELWWLAYDEIFYRECLAYSRYKRLLERLKKFSRVELCAPPAPIMFRSYLEAYGINYKFYDSPRGFPSLGVWTQVFLSLASLPILAFRRPQLLVYTGDRFDPPRDHSFRMRLVYEELRARKLPFVEFIRSLEPGHKMLDHALKRRRPIVYSYALKVILYWIASWLPNPRPVARMADPDSAFRLSLAAAYLSRARADVWSIIVLNLIVRCIGVRAAFIAAASSRTYQELIACRLAGIPTVGILHGAASKYYNVYDFMPEYDGAKRLGVDLYGVWSQGWLDYYLKNGRVYGPEHLKVSGPMRPLKEPDKDKPASRVSVPEERVRVLFVPGELSVPQEVLPYLRALMQDHKISVYLTFRPYRDAFEDWLKQHEPQLIEAIGSDRILRGRPIQLDIAECDVVVGSYSTAVLEALLQLKPLVFFRTAKWGDYFSLKDYSSKRTFFAENPEELCERARASGAVSPEELKKLQEKFFGDPHKNGSAWVVDRLEDVLKKRS